MHRSLPAFARSLRSPPAERNSDAAFIRLIPSKENESPAFFALRSFPESVGRPLPAPTVPPQSRGLFHVRALLPEKSRAARFLHSRPVSQKLSHRLTDPHRPRRVRAGWSYHTGPTISSMFIASPFLRHAFSHSFPHRYAQAFQQRL